MEIVAGEADIDDVDRFLTALGNIADEHDALIQALDARYVVSEEHLMRAVELAKRAHARGEGIATDLALEVLLYATGTRQIERALELGVSRGSGQAIVVVIDGGDTNAARQAVERLIEPRERLSPPDEKLIREWFEITPTEEQATTASVADLVLERVALLVVEK